jgi:CheY-like chemotaxis protein
MRRPLRVLIVEDRVDCSESTALLLRSCGFHVDVASSCSSALVAAQASAPDVILMDIALQGPDDGYKAAKLLREVLQRNPLLIALTGYGKMSDYERSADEGFDHHLVKPVQPETLIKLLQEYADSVEE